MRTRLKHLCQLNLRSSLAQGNHFHLYLLMTIPLSESEGINNILLLLLKQGTFAINLIKSVTVHITTQEVI